MIFVGLYRLFPKICDALAIVKPDTVVRWHRAGFRSYWRWKSRRRGGRPIVPVEIRRLIREMSIANPLWGAPRNPRRASQARRVDRAHSLPPSSRRAAPPIYPDLIYDRHRRRRRGPGQDLSDIDRRHRYNGNPLAWPWRRGCSGCWSGNGVDHWRFGGGATLLRWTIVEFRPICHDR